MGTHVAGMAAWPDANLPISGNLVQVTSREEAALFRAVHLDGRPKGSGQEEFVHYFASDKVLLSSNVNAVVRLDGDQPVSAGLLCEGESVTGLYWIKTRCAFRSRGFGKDVVNGLLALARPGLPVELQSTTAGRRLYQNLGFLDLGLISRWRVVT